MQEAVDDCRIEAEELVEEMSKKVTIEMTQRREVERIVHRLQIENNQLKVPLLLSPPHTSLPAVSPLLSSVMVMCCIGNITNSNTSWFRKEFGSVDCGDQSPGGSVISRECPATSRGHTHQGHGVPIIESTAGGGDDGHGLHCEGSAAED
jgi:hypothetical protein